MYESFYNLRAKPFQLSPDPRFFFNSRGHKRALSYLRYGIRQGEGFIIITGDVGTGKTTLVTALFKALETENVVAAQIVTTNLQADDLVRTVAGAFGLQSDRVSKSTLLRNLETFFKACTEEGKRVLLVVDEVQGLPKKSIEELRMLSNFSLRGRMLLQTFMLGQREFRATMRSEGFEQLRQRVIAAYHLRPLDEDETSGYVRYRLATAGWKNDPVIDEEVFAGIYEFSGGVPRRINTLCDRLMLYGALEELHHLDQAAFDAVTRDIMEEQGASTQELRQVDINAAARLASQSRRLSADEAADAAEREAAEQLEQTVARPAVKRPAPEPATPAAEPQVPAAQDSRLHAVESSVAALADAMREELTMLRQALLEKRGGNNKDE